jgi:hypothetical protein
LLINTAQGARNTALRAITDSAQTLAASHFARVVKLALEKAATIFPRA